MKNSGLQHLKQCELVIWVEDIFILAIITLAFWRTPLMHTFPIFFFLFRLWLFGLTRVLIFENHFKLLLLHIFVALLRSSTGEISFLLPINLLKLVCHISLVSVAREFGWTILYLELCFIGKYCHSSLSDLDILSFYIMSWAFTLLVPLLRSPQDCCSFRSEWFHFSSVFQ